MFWTFFLSASTLINRCLWGLPSLVGLDCGYSLKSNQGIVLGMALSRNWSGISDLALSVISTSPPQTYLRRFCIFKCSLMLCCVFSTDPIHVLCHKNQTVRVPMPLGLWDKDWLLSFTTSMDTVYLSETKRHKVQERFVWLCNVWVRFPSWKPGMKPLQALLSWQ